MKIQISEHFNYKKLIRFTLPTIAMMIFTSIYGVVGAGMATVTSQLVGSVIPLLYFMKKNANPLHLIGFEWDKSALIKSCTNGSSEMMTNMSMSLVNMLYNFQLMRLVGADGVSAYGIIMYVSFIFVSVYIGYSIGVTPIFSFHYGAGNHDELKNLFKKSLTIIIVAAIVLTSIAEVTAAMLASIFVSYIANLLAMTTTAVRLYSLSYLFSGVNILASGIFTAFNDGLVSAAISFLRTLLFQVVMVLLLPMLFGLKGIWLAIVCAEILALAVSVYCFVKYRKKYHYT